MVEKHFNDQQDNRDERRQVEGLPDDPKLLKRLLVEARAERDIYRMVADLLKGGGSGDSPAPLANLPNRLKARVAGSLHRRFHYALTLLYRLLGLDDSTYYYELKALKRPERDKPAVRLVFTFWRRGKGRWGYRRVRHRILEETSLPHLSEKVVRRIMGRYGLLPVYVKATKHYNSYKGELSPTPPNLVKRNFHASRPNRLWLTDITQFTLDGFKAYLSPVIDCFDGMVVSWRLSEHPDAKLTNGMLKSAIATLKPHEHPIIHSDRGCQYRWKGWIRICNHYGLVRSMSAKGCSPDNAAMEGFFGRLKNEFFYYRDWSGVSFRDFKRKLDDWIVYYNTKREKQSLGWKSPAEYRRSLDLAS